MSDSFAGFLGFMFGVAFACTLWWLSIGYEWSERRKIEKRLKYLEGKLLCGQGIFGCKGGPECQWDHK